MGMGFPLWYHRVYRYISLTIPHQRRDSIHLGGALYKPLCSFGSGHFAHERFWTDSQIVRAWFLGAFVGAPVGRFCWLSGTGANPLSSLGHNLFALQMPMSVGFLPEVFYAANLFPLRNPSPGFQGTLDDLQWRRGCFLEKPSGPEVVAGFFTCFNPQNLGLMPVDSCQCLPCVLDLVGGSLVRGSQDSASYLLDLLIDFTERPTGCQCRTPPIVQKGGQKVRLVSNCSQLWIQVI